MSGPRIVAEARAWVGTPYLHQASVRGVGCDCLGLLRGVWRDVLGAEPEPVPAYSRDWAETDRVEVLLEAAGRHLSQKRLGDEAPGDVLVFRMRDGMIAKHVGIAGTVGPGATFIHAYQGHSVVESALTAPWRRRLAARFCVAAEDRE